MSHSATGKATVSFSGIDAKALKAESQRVGGTVTLKHKRDDLTFSLAVSDATLKDVGSLNDAVATAEYNLNGETKLKGSYSEWLSRLCGRCTAEICGRWLISSRLIPSPQTWAPRASGTAWSGTAPSTARAPASRWVSGRR